MRNLKYSLIAMLWLYSSAVFALSGEGYGNIYLNIKINECGSYAVNHNVVDRVFKRYFKWNQNKTWSYVEQLGNLRTDKLLAEEGIRKNLGGSYKITGANTLLLSPNYVTRDYYASFVAAFADELCASDFLDGTPSIKYTKNTVVVNKQKTSAKLTAYSTIYAYGEVIGTMKESVTFRIAKNSFPKLP